MFPDILQKHQTILSRESIFKQPMVKYLGLNRRRHALRWIQLRLHVSKTGLIPKNVLKSIPY